MSNDHHVLKQFVSVCGTTGKRRACKDCSCGLAEELSAEVKKDVPALSAKSSCGSVSSFDWKFSLNIFLLMPTFYLTSAT